jgi:hypothetical protein
MLAGVTHAAGRDDDRAAAHLVQRARALDIGDEFHLHLFRVLPHPGDQLEGVAVDQVGMLPSDARGGGGHRRIDVDLERRQTLAAHQIGQDVDDFLGAADGEGGHDQVAPGTARALESRNDFVLGFGKGAVEAIAVGRFDEQHVGFGHDLFGVVQYRPVGHAEVAGKNHAARLAFAADRHLEPGGTEDVAGVMEVDRYGFSRMN